MKAGWALRIQTAWYQKRLATSLWPLLPLSFVFWLLSSIRRALYRTGLLRKRRLPVPVVVLGNIVAGGAGKTPLCIYLVNALRHAGRTPGIVSRGYGGAAKDAQLVTSNASASLVGDEPLMLVQRTGVPVCVGRDRVLAGEKLLAAHPEIDLIVCDDGLQHLALARDLEIAVVDRRGLGNGYLQPAGPLRESQRRLRSVDALVLNHSGVGDDSDLLGLATGARQPPFAMRLAAAFAYRLGSPSDMVSMADLVARALEEKFFAMAGIAEPERFFGLLAALGMRAELRAFPDHHPFRAEDLAFAHEGVLLMTEKDAVKCAPFYAREAWVVPVSAELAPDLAQFVLERLDGRQAA